MLFQYKDRDQKSETHTRARQKLNIPKLIHKQLQVNLYWRENMEFDLTFFISYRVL